MPDLVTSMKIAAIEAVEASKPVEVEFGNVVSVSPLKINVDQKKTLEPEQLVLSRSVTNYSVEMTVNHMTEIATEIGEPHNHAYVGKKLFTIHNGLGIGDTVILLRMSGGQKYVVLDKIGG